MTTPSEHSGNPYNEQELDPDRILIQLNRLRASVDEMLDEVTVTLNIIQRMLENGDNSDALEYVTSLLEKTEEEEDD